MAIAYTDRERLQKTIREINLKDYKKSDIKEDKDDKFGGTKVSEERLLDVIQYLRSPSGRGNMTNMDVFVEHKKDSHNINNMRGSGIYATFTDEYMKEKLDEERDYYKHNPVNGEELEIREKEKTSLEEIKARYIEEMNALTKKFQDEVNNLK